METEAPPAAEEPPPIHMFSPSRANDRFERLDNAIGVVRAEVAEIRAVQATQYTEFMARFDILQQILERGVASSFVLQPRTLQAPSVPPAPPSSTPAPVDPPCASTSAAAAAQEPESDSDT